VEEEVTGQLFNISESMLHLVHSVKGVGESIAVNLGAPIKEVARKLSDIDRRLAGIKQDIGEVKELMRERAKR